MAEISKDSKFTLSIESIVILGGVVVTITLPSTTNDSILSVNLLSFDISAIFV